MKRLWKLLLPALIVLEVVMVRLGWLGLGTAIAVVVAIEALILMVAVRHIVTAVRRFRSGRKAGVDTWQAFEDGLEAFLPRWIAHLAVLEPRLWICLGRFIFRRVRLRTNEFSYHRRSVLGFLLIAVLLVTPVEVFVIELLLPWAWVRWLLLVLAIYALFWALGLYTSLIALPHRLDSSSIRLRYGILAEAAIEYGNIADVRLDGCRAPKGGDGLSLARGDRSAYLAIAGTTDVTLELRNPQTLQGWAKSTAPVMSLHLAVDDPARLVAELTRRIGAAHPYGGSDPPTQVRET